MEPSEAELEQLLRSHLGSELDPHRGQAVRAFSREVTRPMQRRVFRDSIHRHISRYQPHVQRWATVGLAMAACTALGFYLPRVLSRPAASGTSEVARGNVGGGNAPPGGNGVKVITPEYAGFERTTVVRHVDEGSGVTPDGGFGRRIRQQRLETVRFTDPVTHERYECTIPTEEDLILPLGHQ